MELTQEQERAYQKLDWFMFSKEKMFLLSGFSGTGKTTVIGKFISDYCTKYKMIIAAPTHKALKIILSKIDEPIEFGTVHSILNLKPKIDGYGKMNFVRDNRRPDKLKDFDILIVDECSMIDDSLFNYLQKYKYLKIIFLGDSLQIPPVGTTDSILFRKDNGLKIKQTNLSEIIRQKEGNGIIDLGFNLRNNIRLNNDILKLSPKSDNIKLYSEKDENKILNKLIDVFSSNEFKQDNDYYRVLAWRNKTVDSYNNIIRSIYFNTENLPKIHIGDLLIIRNPVFKDKETILNTNDEVIVKTATEKTCIIDKKRINYYDCFVKTTDGYHVNISILHESSMSVYGAIIKKYKEIALSKMPGTEFAKKAWEKYYDLYNNKFVHFKYNFSLTIHTSQGSTFNNSMIIESDIRMNKDIYERNRILYTAVTRAENIVDLIY